MTRRIVIIGTGQAACQLAASLRERRYDGAITLIGREPGPTYQKPLLSKAFLLGRLAEPDLVLKPDIFFEQKRIEVIEDEVEAIDREAHRLQLRNRPPVPYDDLVLATGAENRRLAIPGAALAGVMAMRSRSEALALRALLVDARRLVIVGAGFIGLEVASVAAQLGVEVIVVEQGERVLARALSAPVSAHLLARHTAGGVRFHFNAAVDRFEGSGQLQAVHLADGTVIRTNLALVAIGVVPNIALATQAGLPTGDGILVDAQLGTEDAAIHAIGDSTNYPHVLYDHRRLRVESIQNAMDQARCLAQTLTGTPTPYTRLPWFWSDQWDIRLQIAGIGEPADQLVLRGDPADGRFSVFRHDAQGRLSAVESINQASDHMAARTLVASRPVLAAEDVSNTALPVRQMAPSTPVAQMADRLISEEAT